MIRSKLVHRAGAAAILVLAGGGLPAESRKAGGSPGRSSVGNEKGLQRILIGPLEPGDRIGTGGWRMRNLRVENSSGIKARIGRGALVFQGDAEIPGAKGDFSVHGHLPGRTEALGLWVCLEAGANVEKLGIQVYDVEGEALMMLTPADWTGWKWIEFATGGPEVRQAYPQPEQNGAVDQPLKGQHVVWFAKAPGAARLVVDGMVAVVDRSGLEEAAEVMIEVLTPDTAEPGKPPAISILAVNYTGQSVSLDCAYTLQRDSALYSKAPPDPLHGTNHARGLRSWTVADGEVIEEGSLTDGLTWTDAGTPYKTDHFTEAIQFVTLDRVRRITSMRWLSGDANHTWFVDVDASVDGHTFSPAAGLRNVDQYKKWGWREFPIASPFEAKVLRFRYHTGSGQKRVPAIRFPCELELYDGVADEAITLPRVGPVLEEGRVTVTVPSRSFTLKNLPVRRRLDSGACFLGIEAAWPGRRCMTYRHIVAALAQDRSLVSADSRFGINAAQAPLAPRLRDLGIGWVRFENMKWPFVSPKPHAYAFDGSVGPWHVKTDEIFRTYREHGLNILSYMFLTPAWASTAPENTPPDRVLTFPPKAPALFGEFCFQVAARYGTRKHPADGLLTGDKQSGLNLVRYYEMWNEPDLNPTPTAAWGGWSAPLDEYYAMMRYGAEAVKQADPQAIVTSAGLAGMQAESVDRWRSYTYPDGKHPLDFVEVINVHYYSGRKPPETATDDGNADLIGNTTFVQDLEELAAWRDRYAPSMPIWMTETGYDSGGPFGTNEAVQAARLPRVVMLCLAYGVEKVFVYRESGSTPSKHACSGVLRNDFTEKPSWFTFGTLVREFRGVTGGAARLPHPDAKVWLLQWNDRGTPLLTAWTVDGTARLGLDFGPCEITDAFGARIEAQHTGQLTLTPFPLYVRGMDASPAWKTLLEDYEVRQRELKKRRARAAACRKYLYDFGGPGRVGNQLLEGMKFPYTPVAAADVWSEDRGYGFNRPALSDENRRWVRSKLDGDGCRLRDGLRFRFRVEPGAYRLSIGFSAHKHPAQIVVGGLPEPLALPLEEKRGFVHTRVTVTSGTVLAISHHGYGEIRWVSLIEEGEP